jgi:ABC-type antimicrobial peptide transport system permease subunit
MFPIGAFAAVAVLPALSGLYGVMAYSVAKRTTGIGIRQATGAQRDDIARLVFGQAVRPSLAAIGAAMALTRLLSGMLSHLSATDPAIFGAVLFRVGPSRLPISPHGAPRV